MRNRTLSHQQLLYKEARSTLTKSEKSKLLREEAGYKGEVLFDQAVDVIIGKQQLTHIKDFLFEYEGGRECQIDNIVIAGDGVFIFEIKYFNFDLTIDNTGNWKFEDGQTMSKSPIAQVLEQKNILQTLFKDINIPLPIGEFAVFMNPNQMIYGLYPGENVLLSFQLDKKLPQILQRNTYDFSEIKRMIETRRKSVSKYYQVYNFDVSAMKPGIICDTCFTFIDKISSHKFFCSSCKKNLCSDDVVGMIFTELKAYNPDFKLNSEKISKLSGGLVTSTTVRKKKHLRK